ncbi:MAG: transketolase [Betaproteobacteria bacterium]|nr:transketolase [Betaproteobacteria bacterium]MBK7079992.1 transketolase [Betaproteobacteria bacterium]MBK7592995.1 transketolase [Betaproteobacteria bacterium]MBK8688026.1 transketolase [Betaproteobacteria bacterium]
MTVTPREMAHAVRFLAMDAITRAGDGHPGTPLGAADICTALFNRHLKFDPGCPQWPDRDRFVQSNGHGSTLIYALLHLAGYEAFPIEQVRAFRELGSHTPGHPEYEPAHGVEVTTGPLGQGIANAAGMAVAEAMLNAEFGDAIVDHYTYALVGDGCLMEGIGHEIVSLAGHLRLGKLIFLYDSNRMTDDGATSQAISEDYLTRFACAGWQVQECDGHDQEALAAAILLAKKDPRPSMIKCNTTIGFGVPRIQNQRVAHGGKLFEDDCTAAREHLGWPHAPFVVPQPIVEEWRKAGSRGAAERRAWEDRLARLDPGQRAKFERLMRGELPPDWERTLRDYKREAAANAPSQPTVRSSGEITRVLSHAIPELVGGAPDLEAATQHKRDMLPFTADRRDGRYLHYGVREHAMGAMMNGMVAHRGVVPYGATFLVFSDYMRHSIRLSAMMSLPVIWVFSHDSIGIGKNGPTHQPVEYLASLRAMPNLDVMRPADAVEAAECWQLAVANRRSPTAIVNSRQALPAIRTKHIDENLCARGAYVLADPEGGGRRATIFASGSEVAIALAARTALQAQGVPTAVISVPCWERFEQQDDTYRAMIVGRGTARVAVEAAVKLGWERFIGEDGCFIGMSTFGASGPEAELFRHFGITPEAVVAAVLRQLTGAGPKPE